LSGNKRHKFIGDVFCGTKPENARIPGYVRIFGLKYGENRTINVTFIFRQLLSMPFMDTPVRGCGPYAENRKRIQKEETETMNDER
jgi:hypothetical protein